MLVCGSLNEKCLTCNQINTEEHRLNECMKYLDNNFATSDKKIPFDTISWRMKSYPEAWNVQSGRGTMNL